MVNQSILLEGLKEQRVLMYIKDGCAVIEASVNGVRQTTLTIPPIHIIDFARMIMDSPEVGTEALGN